jgi:hypothetical protein
VAAPAFERFRRDLEEIGDVRVVQAVAVELAGLIDMYRAVAGGVGLGRRRERGGASRGGCGGDRDRRSGEGNSLFLSIIREIFFFLGRFGWFFGRIAVWNQGVERQFPVPAEQGIRRHGTGKWARRTGNSGGRGRGVVPAAGGIGFAGGLGSHCRRMAGADAGLNRTAGAAVRVTAFMDWKCPEGSG